MAHRNRLYYGDNLDVLRRDVPTASVDMVYLDPPFNSNRNYNVIFARHDTEEDASRAQIQAFGDTWRWTSVTEEQYREYVQTLPVEVAAALTAMRSLLGENDVMAYLVNMTPRLVELRRAMKATGKLFLHCDPTMSRYLKIVMDAISGPGNFRNEIIWSYKRWTSSKKALPRLHDVILFYSKTSDYQIEVPRVPNTVPNPSQYVSAKDESGRTVVARDAAGKPIKRQVAEEIQVGDVWEIPVLSPVSKERLGYPTQKPLRLLRRIIECASKPGDVILDPFCGCGTTVDAAHSLGRSWIGIDITYLAVDLIEKRLQHTHGESVRDTYEVLGIPRDEAAAAALFARSPFDFERWAVSLVSGQPNQRQVKDRGMDGVIRFVTGASTIGRALVSVKGGANLTTGMVRDLLGTVHTEKADMGVLITMGPPTRGMVSAAEHAGSYVLPANQQPFPKIQILTVSDLLSGRRPAMPPTLRPYIAAQRQVESVDQLLLGLE